MIIFKGSPETDTQVWKDAIHESEQKIAVLKQDRARLARKITEDSLISIKLDSAYRTDLKIKERRIIDLKRNPTVIRIREEVPVIDTLILAYDSIVSFQQGRIYSLGKELEGLRVDLQDVSKNYESQIVNHEQIYQTLLQKVEEQQKELKKQIRQKRLFQTLTVVGTIGGVLLGSQ